MEKRKLYSGSAIEITPLTLGTWGIGGHPFWQGQEEKTSIETIQCALDLGVNCIDTAPAYGFGASESLIAKAIKGRREKVILATKCGLRWKDTASAGSLYRDLSASSIREELENSLQRLETDRVDLYQIHWPDPAVKIPETMGTLEKLKQEGKILEIGVSNYDLDMLKEATACAKIASIQPKYNLLEREIEEGILPFCKENGIGILAYSPLASGALSGKYSVNSSFDDWRGKKNFGVFRPEYWEQAMAKVEKLKEVAEDYGFTLSQLAIMWVVEQGGVTSAIIGCNTREQIEENTLALELRTDESLMHAIESAVS